MRTVRLLTSAATHTYVLEGEQHCSEVMLIIDLCFYGIQVLAYLLPFIPFRITTYFTNGTYAVLPVVFVLYLVTHLTNCMRGKLTALRYTNHGSLS